MAAGGGCTESAPAWLGWRQRGAHGVPEKEAKLGAREGELWRLTVGQFGRRVRRWRRSRGEVLARHRAEEGRGGEIRRGRVDAERRRFRSVRRALAGATDGQLSTASGACRPRGARCLRGRVRVAASAGERAGGGGRADADRAEAAAAARGPIRPAGRKRGGGPFRVEIKFSFSYFQTNSNKNFQISF
jgi:hypothetical protein